jgi:hypothetical protein
MECPQVSETVSRLRQEATRHAGRQLLAFVVDTAILPVSDVVGLNRAPQLAVARGQLAALEERIRQCAG